MRTRLSSAQEELAAHFEAELAAAADEDEVCARCDRHGWLRLTLAADRGGPGLGEAEAVLLAEQLGHALHGTAVLDRLAAAEGRGVHGARVRLRRGAYLLGLARRALGQAVAYARSRRQFDGPLSRFQAVTFPLAAHHVRVRGLWLRACELAARVDAAQGVRAGAAAFADLADATAFDAVGHALHVHGARGLTRQEPVSACYRLLLAAGARPDDRPGTADSTGTADKAGRGEAACQGEVPGAARLLARRVPAAWRADHAPVPGPECAHVLFADSVRRFADLPAVCAPDGAYLTYRQLDERANRLAHALRRRGVRADTTVGICLPRGVDLVVAVLAVLKAGGAYVPLDPAYPPRRLAFMAADSRAIAIATADPWAGRLPATPAPLVRTDADADEIRASPAGPPPDDARPGSLAYVVYTSGSTGTPKGVEVEHRGLANRLRWERQMFRHGPGDAVLHHAPLGFDVAAWEILAPLVCGARLVLAPPEGARDPRLLLDTVVDQRVTALTLVPSLLDVLLDWQPGLERATALRHVFAGGEALSPELARRFLTAVPHAGLYHFYGPSEASIDATWWHCTPDNIAEGVPIGHPLAGVRTYLLDDAGAPVPVGATGELVVGGVGVARGYRGRPGDTRERFLPDPFAAEAGARMYRTGDLARHRPDGALDFLGRADDQVKVSGFRVEPREVEAALEEHPAVRQAVVKAVGASGLVGFAACDGHAQDAESTDAVDGTHSPLWQELIGWLRERLPAHMVPGVVQILPAFPLLPNGKVDRAALTPVQEGPAPAAADGQLAGQVAQLMGDVLDRSGIGPDSDFFRLGGTSLQAARFVARLRTRLGAGIDLRHFLEDPTCGGVVRRIEDGDVQGRGLP
ncbi:amino acid adenylation domain-containing protein [Streptoverticillium reticulum]|uniref:amino acid adenylation domain-containing protein n=1 Tax=Streptoverticillium reticulum TaxID=1433415 RepID=UPI0039BEEFF3